MSEFLKKVTLTAVAAFVAASALSTTASAAPVAPKNIRFAISKHASAGCPAKVMLQGTVVAEASGHVQIRFQRDDGWISPPVWYATTTTANGKYVVRYNKLINGIPGNHNFKARMIASGMGTTKYSKWDKLKIKC